MSETIIRVLKPGSNCVLGDIKVHILSTRIEISNKVSYEVSWIVNGDRKTAWVEEFELTTDDVDYSLEVGFE